MSDDLKSRLRKLEGGDKYGSTVWYRNPDGPEAADYIEKLELIEKAYQQNQQTWSRNIARIEKLEADLETATMKRLLDSDRIEKLKAALREIDIACDYSGFEYVCRGIARKALEWKDD
jgi:hypothetical protein